MPDSEQDGQYQDVEQGRARQHHEHHIGEEGEHQRRADRGQRQATLPEELQNQRSQRENAQREFLALTDGVLQRHARGLGRSDLPFRREQHDP